MSVRTRPRRLYTTDFEEHIHNDWTSYKNQMSNEIGVNEQKLLLVDPMIW